MGDLKKFLKSLDPPKKSRVAFNSSQERKTFPQSFPPNRLGLTMMPPSQPVIVLGDNKLVEMTSFVREIQKKVASRHGYVVRREARFRRPKDSKLPISYVGIAQPKVKQYKKPFMQGAIFDRPPAFLKDCAPCQQYYGQDYKVRGKTYKQHSFGGPTAIIPPVKIKCVPHNLDECDKCHERPVGVYYQQHNETLCRACFNKLKLSRLDVHQRVWLKSFKKVRDCSFFHDHHGSHAATWLLPQKDLRKLQRYEAYLNRFFSDIEN